MRHNEALDDCSDPIVSNLLQWRNRQKVDRYERLEWVEAHRGQKKSSQLAA
ncbi:hypothetical protein [Vibrio neptunius]|uniref:Transposase n=1 Tax=Vibrio neptunius TaxID=170651 RepID=A0ABS3A2E5_9VIBR|nr:hypothetical protein [Vibrio neptunius]MBN3493732.1 hypothetical protein [Vibrio neptunius]MBN3516228.1 hypothetical protein [Vibrio neptunius]MBN3550173.1 hypothetical protein [Vibrio neptunius]MBN3578563.1 hypothetical protein [Vibrio neptunius]MCH9872228.1 hypothetical protein [Vibrio neptunius]